jgi:hypothetical protein
VCCCLPPSKATTCRSLAICLTVLSLVSFVEGYLTHQNFVRKASAHLRRHLVFIVGFFASILAVTGALLLLLASPPPLAPDEDAVVPVPAVSTCSSSNAYFGTDGTGGRDPLLRSIPDAGAGPDSVVAAWEVFVAVGCMVAAALSAHGVAGHVLHGGRKAGWAFFQPFRVRAAPRRAVHSPRESE